MTENCHILFNSDMFLNNKKGGVWSNENISPRYGYSNFIKAVKRQRNLGLWKHVQHQLFRQFPMNHVKMKICCLTTFPTIFQLYRSSHFIGIWRKTSNLSQVTDKLYYIMLYGVHHITQDTIFTIGIDCIEFVLI
jgi:hypothetical protein